MNSEFHWNFQFEWKEKLETRWHLFLTRAGSSVTSSKKIAHSYLGNTTNQTTKSFRQSIRVSHRSKLNKF